jgi:hypothetical protein
MVTNHESAKQKAMSVIGDGQNRLHPFGCLLFRILVEAGGVGIFGGIQNT